MKHLSGTKFRKYLRFVDRDIFGAGWVKSNKKNGLNQPFFVYAGERT